MRQPESVLKKSILEYLNLNGHLVWSNKSTGTYDPRTRKFRKNNGKFEINGVSDILGITKDFRPLALEVKTSTGRVSDSQKAFLERFQSYHGLCGVVRSIEDCEALGL